MLRQNESYIAVLGYLHHSRYEHSGGYNHLRRSFHIAVDQCTKLHEAQCMLTFWLSTLHAALSSVVLLANVR